MCKWQQPTLGSLGGLLRQAMPPKNFISSFPASDANNEIDCPLKYKDGASCRKRCNGVSGQLIYCFILAIELHQERMELKSNCSVGEAVSVNAGAHQTSTRGKLYREASCDGGKHSAYDQYPTFSASTAPTYNTVKCIYR